MSFKCKPNKVWVEKGRKFYSRSIKSWFQDDTDIYSTHNKGESVTDERFFSTLKNKIYKYMTWISKNVYIDKLDEVVNDCNNTYHSTIKMKPTNVKSSTYINFNVEIDKDLNLKLVTI